MGFSLERIAGRLVVQRSTDRFSRTFLSRSFPKHANRRVLIYYHRHEISWAQVYPFLFYASCFANRYGAYFRYLPIETLLSDSHEPPNADIVLVQPWFTVSPTALKEALERLAKALPKAEVSFLDSYAHNDLRLGKTINPFIRHYFKKSLFRDPQLYTKPFRGDTNLTDYYSALYDIDAPEVDWRVPPDMLDKLRLMPHFLTASRFMTHLSRRDIPQLAQRNLDVFTRLGSRGSPWYAAMRQHANAAIDRIGGITISQHGHLGIRPYMKELRQARLCFSPFGYGELCWRDIEAMVEGSVLIKPNMDHLRTDPDLFISGETYLPVRWDFSDLEEVVKTALEKEDVCARIAQNAYNRMADYVREGRFVRDMKFFFDPEA